MSLQKGTVEFPFQWGLKLGLDSRIQDDVPLGLSGATNVYWDETGKLVKRYGYTSIGLTTTTGSITAADTRRLAVRKTSTNDELLLFTKDSLYSWNPSLSKWSFRDYHYAVANTETNVCNKQTNQDDPNRAELDGYVAYTWTDGSLAVLRLSIYDKASGAPVITDYALDSSATPIFARIFAMEVSNQFMVVWSMSTGVIKAKLVDPTDTTTSLAVGATPAASYASANYYWDACKYQSASVDLVWVVHPDATGYDVVPISVTPGTPPVISVGTVASKARPSDSSVAIAHGYVASALDRLVIVRHNTTTGYITTDQLDGLTGADVAGRLSLNIGTITVGNYFNKLGAVWKTTADGGAYRAYAFWGDENNETTDDAENETTYSYVDSAGAVSASTVLAYFMTPCTKPFLYNGVPCLGLRFDRVDTQFDRLQAQASVFLWHLTGGLIGQATQREGAGQTTYNWLPEITSYSSTEFYTALGVRRRYTQYEDRRRGERYADLGIADIKWTFDSDLARRTSQWGQSLYISGSVVMEYSGDTISEAGFLYTPFNVIKTTGTSGSMSVGEYFYRFFYESRTTADELILSTYSIQATLTLSGVQDEGVLTGIPAYTSTRRTGTDRVATTIYRTTKYPSQGSPLRRVTNPDSSTTGSQNGYIVSDSSTGYYNSWPNDGYDDATLLTKEMDYISKGEIDNIAPPPCTIIANGQGRVWLAGLKDPNTVWYSKTRIQGRALEFNEALSINLPSEGGSITGIGFVGQEVLIFKERATYVISGTGPDNTGLNGQYTEPRLISDSNGARNQDLIAQSPVGCAFMGRSGPVLITNNYEIQPIGDDVSSLDNGTHVRAISVPDYKHVRFYRNQVTGVTTYTAQGSLVWDYGTGNWSSWTCGVKDAVLYNNIVYVIYDTGTDFVGYEDTASYTDNATAYTMVVFTKWLRLSDKWDYHRIRRIGVHGTSGSGTTMLVHFYFDGDDAVANVDAHTWTIASVSGTLRGQFSPAKQKMGAIKIFISDNGGSNDGFGLTSLLMEVGYKNGLSRLPSTYRS